MSDAPIGIFDSGLGGLTVAKRVLEKLPHESIIYLGDEIHVPYGERSSDKIRDLALGITGFLIANGAKLVIMACNMSSANALDAAREAFPGVPIIGTIKAGARTAVGTAERRIGVLATNGTVATRAYTRTIQALDGAMEVLEQGCPKFVPLVESDMCDSCEADDAAREYAEPLRQAGCDTLILGCTHYPFLIRAIRNVVGPDIGIVDPAEETVDEAYRILLDAGLLNSPNTEPVHAYYTTASPRRFERLGGRFLGNPVCVRELTWGMDLRDDIWQEMTAGRTMNSVR